MTETRAKRGTICDANVLIDYAISAPNIIKLTSKYIRQLYIALPTLHEVRQITIENAQKLGIELIEPTLTQIIEANELKQEKPTLSGQDAICFVLAKDNGSVCLTNDKPLRDHCLANKITCLWGFEIMLRLVSCGKLTVEKAYKTAQDIQAKNKYIKAETVAKFKKKLGL